ncbi:unnamed protein product [Alopecurus aequalis]
MEEDWVLLGESDSDADTVQSAGGSESDGSASDKGNEMSFTTVQTASAADLPSGGGSDEELQRSPVGGEKEDEEDSLDQEESDLFDIDVPALAGSKAASGDGLKLDLPTSPVIIGGVGYETGIIDTKDTDSDKHLGDIDMESIGAAVDGMEHPERRVCVHCANNDIDEIPEAQEVVNNNIDTGSSDPAGSDYVNDTEHSQFGYNEIDGTNTKDTDSHAEQPESCPESIGAADDGMDQHPEQRVCANNDTEQSPDAQEAVSYNDIDTGSSDLAESDYVNDTDHSEFGSACCDEEQPESCSCGRHLDDLDTENSDAEESNYSDDDTESSGMEERYYIDDDGTLCSEGTGTTGGDDTRNSDVSIALQMLADAIEALRSTSAPHLFSPNGAGSSTAASQPPNTPHLFFSNLSAGASTAASLSPGAPGIKFGTGINKPLVHDINQYLKNNPIGSVVDSLQDQSRQAVPFKKKFGQALGRLRHAVQKAIHSVEAGLSSCCYPKDAMSLEDAESRDGDGTESSHKK